GGDWGTGCCTDSCSHTQCPTSWTSSDDHAWNAKMGHRSSRGPRPTAGILSKMHTDLPSRSLLTCHKVRRACRISHPGGGVWANTCYAYNQPASTTGRGVGPAGHS